jgi:very-short-patch-repair endonuclease
MAVLRGPEVYPFYFGAKPETLRLAGELRRNMTPQEKLLWEHVRNKKLDGYRFRRQHPIGEFIVDFFCYDAMLVVELDGKVHKERSQLERDIQRTKLLNRHGLRVIRFRNEEVERNIQSVIRRIRRTLSEARRSAVANRQ